MTKYKINFYIKLIVILVLLSLLFTIFLIRHQTNKRNIIYSQSYDNFPAIAKCFDISQTPTIKSFYHQKNLLIDQYFQKLIDNSKVSLEYIYYWSFKNKLISKKQYKNQNYINSYKKKEILKLYKEKNLNLKPKINKNHNKAIITLNSMLAKSPENDFFNEIISSKLANHNIYPLTLAGHESTIKNLQNCFNLENSIDELEFLIESTKEEKLNIIGYSAGGGIIMTYLTNFYTQINHLKQENKDSLEFTKKNNIAHKIQQITLIDPAISIGFSTSAIKIIKNITSAQYVESIKIFNILNFIPNDFKQHYTHSDISRINHMPINATIELSKIAKILNNNAKIIKEYKIELPKITAYFGINNITIDVAETIKILAQIAPKSNIFIFKPHRQEIPNYLQKLINKNINIQFINIDHISNEKHNFPILDVSHTGIIRKCSNYYTAYIKNSWIQKNPNIDFIFAESKKEDIYQKFYNMTGKKILRSICNPKIQQSKNDEK